MSGKVPKYRKNSINGGERVFTSIPYFNSSCMVFAMTIAKKKKLAWYFKKTSKHDNEPFNIFF